MQSNILNLSKYTSVRVKKSSLPALSFFPMSPQHPPSPPQSTRRLTLPRIFQNEIRQMMSGFGDQQAPRPESVRLMEEIVLEYITGLAAKSTEIAQTNRRERPDVTDIKFIIRKDKRKLQRVRYLLEMKAEIKRATNVDAEEIVNADV